jgi:hypothetical protein
VRRIGRGALVVVEPAKAQVILGRIQGFANQSFIRPGAADSVLHRELRDLASRHRAERPPAVRCLEEALDLIAEHDAFDLIDDYLSRRDSCSSCWPTQEDAEIRARLRGKLLVGA